MEQVSRLAEGKLDASFAKKRSLVYMVMLGLGLYHVCSLKFLILDDELAMYVC